MFDRPGNGAVEMFSRRTMQIRRSPQGDAVNGFNHQQDLQRGCVFVCVCVYTCACECMCAYAGASKANMLPASCKQIGQLLGRGGGTLKWINKGLEKFKTVSVLTFYPSKHWMSPRRFWEKIFLTHWSRLWQWEQRWLPNMDRDENSSVECHKFNFNLCPINSWLGNWGRNKDQSLDAKDFLLWTSACFSGDVY